MAGEILIDWQQLDVIREECGEAIVDIFREFITEYPAHEARFTDALAAADPVKMSKAAHQLKGSSANFGMIAVVGAMQTIEGDAEKGQLPTSADLEAVRILFKDSIRLIQQERPELV